uniref:Uncharacterized protein n=1 Tax=Coccidioides posadasii RMSCC 3488 TaxID=454284 RepID=A0A0J6FGW3_COCPO|nr:hypothetical protein CPAG_04435 [Coccidioides posadasii RMSCC 3488]
MTFTGSSHFAFRTKESRSKMPFFRQQSPRLCRPCWQLHNQGLGKTCSRPDPAPSHVQVPPEKPRAWPLLGNPACIHDRLGRGCTASVWHAEAKPLMSKLISSGARSFINDVEQGVTNSVHKLGFASALNLPCQNNNSHQLTRYFHIHE